VLSELGELSVGLLGGLSGSKQGQGLRGREGSIQLLGDGLEGIDRQHPAGGPLAPKQADQPTIELFDFVLANHLAATALRVRLNQRATAGPAAGHREAGLPWEPLA